MIYTVDPLADEPIMLLNKHIGFDEEDGQGIDGSLFQQELLQLDQMGKRAIQVWINCPGGSVVEGYNIYNAILKSKTPVDTYNVGVAASMGGVVFMAGRKRKMADYALLMIHPPSGGENKKVLDAMAGSLVKMISAKSHTPETDVRFLMESTSWLTASECMARGFCTEIEATKEANSIRVTDVRTMWKQSTRIVNSILSKPAQSITKNTSKNTVMTKVTMKLGLVEAASEDNIIDAIKGIENRAYTAETRLIQMENETARKLKEVQDKATADIAAAKKEIEDAQAETEAVLAEKEKVSRELVQVKSALTKLDGDLKNITAKYEEMEAEKLAAIEAEKETKAKGLIESHVRTGRLKNDAKVIQKWVNLAKEDYEGTREMIEAIPLSVKAPVIQTDLPGATNTPEKMETSAMSLAVRNKLKREGKLN